MKCTGVLKEPSLDFSTGKLIISVQVNEDVREYLDKLMTCENLDVEIKKHREKRSLDANAYAWVLMSKIASVLGSSKEEIYEEMLRRYGVLYEDEDGYITITVRTDVDMGKIEGHWMKIKDNGKYAGYAMIKGSSKYDTKEMSVFIDGIVSDCRELGIETMTPAELERMVNAWQNG